MSSVTQQQARRACKSFINEYLVTHESRKGLAKLLGYTAYIALETCRFPQSWDLPGRSTNNSGGIFSRLKAFTACSMSVHARSWYLYDSSPYHVCLERPVHLAMSKCKWYTSEHLTWIGALFQDQSKSPWLVTNEDKLAYTSGTVQCCSKYESFLLQH